MEKIREWSLFIIRCADDTYYTGWTKSIVEKEIDKTLKNNKYFKYHPERLPVELVFKETGLPFKEAYYKFCYMRKKMNKRQKVKLARTKKWPFRRVKRNPDSDILNKT